MMDTTVDGYNDGYNDKNHYKNMNQKDRHKNNEMKYRKTRIDRHNTAVNKFLDNAIANKKSVTRAIHELLDREAQLEAQLRQSEQDKINEVLKVTSVLFKNVLPDYRAGQLTLWMAAFNKRFVERDPEYDLQRAIEAIEETDRENSYLLIKAAKPIKGRE
jgi:hypothetical protein